MLNLVLQSTLEVYDKLKLNHNAKKVPSVDLFNTLPRKALHG